MTRGPHEPSRAGIVLVGPALKPIYSNREALSILAYPDPPDSIKTGDSLGRSPFKQVLSRLVKGSKNDGVELRSGKRRYSCRAFSLNSMSRARAEEVVLVSLDRPSSPSMDAPRLSDRFGLTKREAEAALLLVGGLTNKQIAARMQIAPNTVKAFLKIVMLKMRVPTRSGVVGKIGKA